MSTHHKMTAPDSGAPSAGQQVHVLAEREVPQWQRDVEQAQNEKFADRLESKFRAAAKSKMTPAQVAFVVSAARGRALTGDHAGAIADCDATLATDGLPPLE